MTNLRYKRNYNKGGIKLNRQIKEKNKMNNILDNTGIINYTLEYVDETQTITLNIIEEGILVNSVSMTHDEFLKHITIEPTEMNLNFCLNMAINKYRRDRIMFYLEDIIYSQRFKGRKLPILSDGDKRFLIWTIHNREWLQLDEYLSNCNSIEDKLLNIALYPIFLIERLIEDNDIRANSGHFFRQLIRFLRQENRKIQLLYSIFPVQCIYNRGVFQQSEVLNCLDIEEYDDGM